MTKMWRALLLVLFVAGVVAAAGKAFFWGESVTKYGAYVPWGLWIGIYIALVGAAAGCVGVGAWLTTQENDEPGPAMPAALVSGAVILAFGLAFVGVDLGKPMQGFRIFLHPSFSSPLAWASWLYVVFFACVAGYFLTKTKRPLMWLAVLCAIGFTVAEGLFFGRMVARPLWNSAITTILFLAAAAASGSALLLLTWSTAGLNVSEVMLAKLRRLLLWSIVLYAAVEGVDVAMAMGGDPTKAMAAKRMISSYGFWLLYGIVGTLAPLFLLLQTKRDTLAAAMVLVGAIGSKYAFVRYGFWGEPMPGIVQAFQDSSLQTRYFPSPVEWIAGVGLLAGAILVTVWAIEKFVMPKTAQ